MVALLACQPLLCLGDGDVERIFASEIEAEKPPSLMALLKKHVGVGESNGAISLRGVPKVALYLDGIPLSGTVVALDGIHPHDVEVIELYRGAASARFGADALGGAILVKTKRGGKAAQLDWVQGLNSLHSRHTKVIGNAAPGGTDLRLAVEESRTNRIFNIDRNNIPFPYLYPVEESYATRRAGELKAANSRGALASGLSLAYSEDAYHWGRPNYFRNDTSFNPKLKLDLALQDDQSISATAGYQKIRQDVVRDQGGIDAAGLSPSLRLGSDSEGVSLDLRADLRDLKLGMAYSLEKETQTQNDFFSRALEFELKDTIEKIGLYSGLSHDFLEKGTLDASVRLDRYRYREVQIFTAGVRSFEPDVTRHAINPELSLKWRANPSTMLRGSVGAGYIPPSPASLYYQETGAGYRILPNPGLKPERSIALDAGVEGSLAAEFKGSLVFYYTRWLDKMESLTLGGTPPTSQIRNIGESESRGMEISLKKEFTPEWQGAFNHTLTMTRVTRSASAETIGNELPHTPRHRGNFSLSWQGLANLSARAALRYESAQFTDSRNLVRDEQGHRWQKGGYAVVDISLGGKMKTGPATLDLTFAIDNLTDKRYQKKFFERDPGRVIRGEVALRFQ